MTDHQLAWLMRYGEGLTLREIGRRLDRSAEWVRTMINRVDGRIALAWRSNKSASTMPAWWRRLRAANAFRPTTAWRYEPHRFTIPEVEASP